MAEADDLLLEEWSGVLAELWTAAGKPLEADRLQVYRQSLGEVPLGLLERAMRRVIRENVYHVVTLLGVVWAAGVGGSVECEAGVGGLGREEVEN